MSERLYGNSQLATLARSFPVRQRVGLTLVAAALALRSLQKSPDYPTEVSAFELGRRWYDREPMDPDQLEDALHDEEDEGVDILAQMAPSERESNAWTVLGSALGYTAYHAYLSAGQLPGALVSEVREDEVLDSLDQFARALLPNFSAVLERAAEYLRSPAGAGQLAQLLSYASNGG